MLNFLKWLNNKRLCRKGVTLTELLAAVSIIGVTTAIIAPDAIEFTNRIRNSLAELKQYSEVNDHINSLDFQTLSNLPFKIPFNRSVTPVPEIPSILIPQLKQGNKMFVTVYYYDESDGTVHSCLYEYDIEK